MKFNYIYWVKRSPLTKRLRVKIDGRAYCCGYAVKDTPFFISRIDASGEIELTDSNTGAKFWYTGINVKKYQDTNSIPEGENKQ